MATDINSVVLVGRLTRDIELTDFGNDRTLGKFSLAVNRVKGSGDQREDEVSFFNVSAWGKYLHYIERSLTKGTQVCINGELRQNRWEQDGQARQRVEIVANSIQLLSSSSGASNAPSNQSDNRSYSQNKPSKPAATGERARGNNSYNNAPSFPGPEQFDDDIPF
ncbi:MAG: single-stranded DNA-binding protein [Spirochaetia bacterium]|nr:single-stranded DNA-binding protein [Spirochaetia bacterium]